MLKEEHFSLALSFFDFGSSNADSDPFSDNIEASTILGVVFDSVSFKILRGATLTSSYTQDERP